MRIKKPCTQCGSTNYPKKLWLKLLGPDRIFCSDDCIFEWMRDHQVRDEHGEPITELENTKTHEIIRSKLKHY